MADAKDIKIQQQIDADKRSVFIGNLEPGVTPEMIETHFKDCGIINRITLCDKNVKSSYSYAYVEFSSLPEKNLALLLNGTNLCSQKITVYRKKTNYARYKKNNATLGNITFHSKATAKKPMYSNGVCSK